MIVLVIILTSAVQFYFRYSNFMKQKSIIIGLPVVPFNQSKHSDVCQYLQYVQDMLVDIFTLEVCSVMIRDKHFIWVNLVPRI